MVYIKTLKADIYSFINFGGYSKAFGELAFGNFQGLN